MLLEFLPHLTRLIPAADTYLSSRRESDKAFQVALADLTAEVRAGLGKAVEEQSTLRTQVQAQIASSAHLASELAHVRTLLETLETRARATEKRLNTIWYLLWSALVLLTVLLVIVAIRTWR